MPTETLVKLFDAATKVTSGYGLGAFAIVAVLAIVYLTVTRRVLKSSVPLANLSLTPMWFILFFAIAIPVAGEVIIKLNPDLPYAVRVFAVDIEKGLVPDVHVVSTAGGEPSKIDGGSEFQIPPSSLPGDHMVTFFVSGAFHGQKDVRLEKARSVSIEIDVTASPSPQPVETPVQTPAEPVKPKPGHVNKSIGMTENLRTLDAPIDSGWLGSYRYLDSSPQPEDWWTWANFTLSINVNSLSLRWDLNHGTHTDCHAIFEGKATRTDTPRTINFTASRPGIESDDFCDYRLPVAISGTIQRTGDYTLKADIPSLNQWAQNGVISLSASH
jgi:hypothetical protein